MSSVIFTVTGVSPHRKQHQEAQPGHASHLQQTLQPVLLPLGAGHHLKEEEQGASFNQPGLHSGTLTLQAFDFVFSSRRCNNCKEGIIFACRCNQLLYLWLQVFVDGMEPVRKPLERMFEDSASEKSVRTQSSLLDKNVKITQMSRL